MSAKQESVPFGNIRQDFSAYLAKPESIETLKQMDKPEQKAFIINLIATATQAELDNITRASTQVLGGKVSEELQQLFSRGLAARRDFFLMVNRDLCNNIAAYLAVEEDILETPFNSDLHRQFNGLVDQIPQAERHQWLYQMIVTAGDRHMGALGRLFNQQNAFGQKVAGEFELMLAMLKLQDLTQGNPAEVLASKAFNPAVYHQFAPVFAQHVKGKTGAIIDAFDLTEMTPEQKGRIIQNITQMSNGLQDNFVQELRGVFFKQAEPAQGSNKDSSSSPTSDANTMGKSGLFRRNSSSDNKASHGVSQDVVDDVKCPPCNIL